MTTEPNTGPLLSLEDLRSPTWVKLSRLMADRLTSNRVKNDAELTESQTARLRGANAELKYLLALANRDPAYVADDE